MLNVQNKDDLTAERTIKNISKINQRENSIDVDSRKYVIVTK